MKNNYLFAIVLTLVLSGCQSTFGPDSLNNTHPAYNQTIVNTLNEQMLLNLVRLKYRDKAFFLKISSVTAAMTFGGNLGVEGTANFGATGGLVNPSIGISYADRPTISYTPLQGEEFLKSVLSSIPLEAVLVMTQSGWSVERIFGLCMERINDLYNAPRASGPTPDQEPEFRKFKRLLELMRELQLKGDVEIGPDLNINSNISDIVILFAPSSVNPDVLNEISKLLDLGQKAPREMTHKVKISTNFIDKKPNQLNVRIRSISSIMYYLSQNVKTPKEHIDAGLVTVTKTSDGKGIFNWEETPAGEVFQVNVSAEFPENAFIAVPYRDYWFYILDNDLQSKSTFMLLTLLFDLQAGQTAYTGPTLTLPVR